MRIHTAISKTITYLLVITLVFNLCAASWYVLHSDIRFISDVARDFLLFGELQEKGIMLLGPRASGIPGLFHGPLWLYLTFPGYVLGGGSPVVVGWYWMGMIVASLAGGYVVVKRLFDERAARIFVVLTSALYISEGAQLINPHGAFMLLPIAFYALVRYFQTTNWRWLAGYWLLLGCIIQFQMAVGIPLFLLSLLPLIIFVYKKKTYIHLLTGIVIAIPLSTFVVFELTHNFAQLRAVLNSSVGESADAPSMTEVFRERMALFSNGGMGVFRASATPLNYLLFGLLGWFYLFKVKNREKTEKNTYFLAVYLYCGYWLLTLLFPGHALFHHWFPITSLSMLMVAGVLAQTNWRVGGVIISIILLHFAQYSFAHIKMSETIIGTAFDSWQFQQSLTDNIIAQSSDEFGYFAYSPDIYAYGPKYALLYMKRQHTEKDIYSFEKKPETFVTIEPIPADRDDLNSRSWIQEKFGITSQPVASWSFENGYSIEKYTLEKTEVEQPIDPNLDTGVFFR